MNFNQIHEVKVKAELQELCKDKKLVIWGAGLFGYDVFKVFRKYGFEKYIVSFCDNCETKWNTYIYNLKVLSYNQIKEAYKNNIIFIICSTSGEQELKDQLSNLKEQYVCINVKSNPNIYKMVYLNQMGKVSKDLYKEIAEKDFEQLINDTSEILDDEESKSILSARINFIKTSNGNCFDNIDTTKPEYFLNNFYEFTDKEVYVDLGAYNGDTILKFVNIVKSEYKKIIAFEPDKKNYKALESNIKKNNLKNIDIYNLGSWNKKANIGFDCGYFASSHVNKNLDNKIQVDALDNLFLDTPITFIKMDIEGAEKESLFGTKKIIQKYKPKLAICVYHKWEDIYEIPRILKSFVPNYKIYLRHHSNNLNETICYACL